jgi:uncharacterized protein YdaU (DUF1376 family)
MASAGKTDIWMPLYIGDYRADTSRLTTEQHGAYLLLLMDYWRNGALPDNDAVLAQITLLSPDAWAMQQASLKHFFKRENGLLVHARVEKELAKARSKQQNLSKRGKHGAATRWASRDRTEGVPVNATSNAIGNATGIAQAMPNSMLADAPSPSPSYKELNTLALKGESETSLESSLKDSGPLAKQTKVSVSGKGPVGGVAEIYRAYPRHVAPGDARQAILKAIARIAKADGASQPDATEKLLRRVEGYAAQVKRDGTELRFVPHPATWFNKERYDDDSLQGESSNADAVKYTDPASVYESPEYQGARRSA